ncbi:putative DNA polymerase III, epsilon subunit [Streptococcus porcinus]|uniref:BRCT domain-containing protein n=1 Tax=Streptococcus porcinus TaxID=1340 RepID=UPI0010CABDB8|nr:BRCT domain-containing protein [Streptococcus porcinus]VTS39087.1 putative DNA polymerase III, epsilon subunit [Streptococcus porcinus]
MDFQGKVVAITGSLRPLERSEVIEFIKVKGGTYQNYVSSQTDVLIIGHRQLTLFELDHYSKKYEKAEMLINSGQNITFIGEEDFFTFFQESL